MKWELIGLKKGNGAKRDADSELVQGEFNILADGGRRRDCQLLLNVTVCNTSLALFFLEVVTLLTNVAGCWGLFSQTFRSQTETDSSAQSLAL